MTPRELDFGLPTERDMLACLEWIPVRRYNWSEEEWWNMDEYPLLTIFKKLLDPTYPKTGYDLVDGSWPVLPRWVKARCDAVAENRGEPFDILPRLVDYVLRETGNDLLDNDSAANEMDFPVELGYKWDRPEDIEELKRLYAEAGPTWKRILGLCEYLDTDEVIEDFLDELFYGGSDGEENKNDDTDN